MTGVQTCALPIYIVDAGDYYFTAATDAHNAVNNILAAKGYTVENTDGRMTADGDVALTYKWTNAALDSTTFEYSDFNVTESADAFNVTLKVTNTGSTYSGKETVQLYFQSPYTDYDKANGIEKASAELCGFAKTDILAPGASEDRKSVV